MLLLAVIALATFASAIPQNFSYAGFQSRHLGCPGDSPPGSGSLGIVVCYLVTTLESSGPREITGYMKGCIESPVSLSDGVFEAAPTMSSRNSRTNAATLFHLESGTMLVGSETLTDAFPEGGSSSSPYPDAVFVQGYGPLGDWSLPSSEPWHNPTCLASGLYDDE